MAARCGLSKYHFLRSLKQYTGFTPYDHLNTLRIAQAKTLLAGTDLPAYRIGQLVVFPGEARAISAALLKANFPVLSHSRRRTSLSAFWMYPGSRIKREAIIPI